MTAKKKATAAAPKKNTEKAIASKASASSPAKKAPAVKTGSVKKTNAAKRPTAKKTTKKAKAKAGALQTGVFLQKDAYKECMDGLRAQGLDHQDAVDTLRVGLREANGRPLPRSLRATQASNDGQMQLAA